MVEQTLFEIVFGIFVVLAMMGIWNCWVWIGKDGYNLPYELRPGFFRFYFYIAPRFLLGFRTGMEDITL